MLFPPQMIRISCRSRSIEPFYDENGPELWDFFKRLFELMNSGGTLNRITLPEINGGLFEPDPLIDGLSIPNHVFAKAGQGAKRSVAGKRSEYALLSLRPHTTTPRAAT